MTKFIKGVETEMRAGLVGLANVTGLAKHTEAIHIIKRALLRLRDHIHEFPFTSIAEEIQYFKTLAPGFYSQFFYHLKLQQVELGKLHMNREGLQEMLKNEGNNISDFYWQHRDFCKYYHYQETAFDDRYFVADSRENSMTDEIEVMMGKEFSYGCYLAARFTANRLLRPCLEQELETLNCMADGTTSIVPSRKLKWQRSKTDLMELCNGLYLTGAFGEVPLKDIVGWFEEHADINLGRYYDTNQEIGRRIKTVTKYTDELKRILTRKFG